MTTTTHIANIADQLDLTAYAGEFAADVDMDAVHADYVAAIDAAAPSGVTVAANGMVFADVAVADEARAIDWAGIAGDVDVVAIFERHSAS